MKQPYNRITNVSISTLGGGIAVKGFGTILFLTTKKVDGKLDATAPVTEISDAGEILDLGYTASDAAYIAASTVFGQQKKPISMLVGYLDKTDANSVVASLEAINDIRDDFYFVGLEQDTASTLAAIEVAKWAQTTERLAILDDSDIANETAGTSGLAGELKGLYGRVAVFYQKDAKEYGGMAMASVAATHSFDDPDSAYTLKFKRLAGIPALDVKASIVTAVTGFKPALGFDTASGNMANCVINVGGVPILVEGVTTVPDTFIDQVHATDYLVARTREAILDVMIRNERIPYSQKGIDQVTSVVRDVMKRGQISGIVAVDEIDPNDRGNVIYGAQITPPNFFNISAAQRQSRILPAISVKIRYNGAVHYTTVNLNLTF